MYIAELIRSRKRKMPVSSDESCLHDLKTQYASMRRGMAVLNEAAGAGVSAAFRPPLGLLSGEELVRQLEDMSRETKEMGKVNLAVERILSAYEADAAAHEVADIVNDDTAVAGIDVVLENARALLVKTDHEYNLNVFMEDAVDALEEEEAPVRYFPRLALAEQTPRTLRKSRALFEELNGSKSGPVRHLLMPETPQSDRIKTPKECSAQDILRLQRTREGEEEGRGLDNEAEKKEEGEREEDDVASPATGLRSPTNYFSIRDKLGAKALGRIRKEHVDVFRHNAPSAINSPTAGAAIAGSSSGVRRVQKKEVVKDIVLNDQLQTLIKNLPNMAPTCDDEKTRKKKKKQTIVSPRPVRAINARRNVVSPRTVPLRRRKKATATSRSMYVQPKSTAATVSRSAPRSSPLSQSALYAGQLGDSQSPARSPRPTPRQQQQQQRQRTTSRDGSPVVSPRRSSSTTSSPAASFLSFSHRFAEDVPYYGKATTPYFLNEYPSFDVSRIAEASTPNKKKMKNSSRTREQGRGGANGSKEFGSASWNPKVGLRSPQKAPPAAFKKAHHCGVPRRKHITSRSTFVEREKGWK
jgi:hypothetical protein